MKLSMVLTQRKLLDLGVAKKLHWGVIILTLYAAIVTVTITSAVETVETFSDDAERSYPFPPRLTTRHPTTNSTVDPNPLIPDFKGKSLLHSYCDYILYTVLYLPMQKSVIGKNRTDILELPPEFFTTYDEAVIRFEFTEFHVQDVICNSEGLQIGFQTPMQCSNITKRCECLTINDLRTVQPLGVVGCLAELGSYCIPGAIECAFGYDCIQGHCAGAINLIPSSNIIVATIMLITYVMYNLQ